MPVIMYSDVPSSHRSIPELSDTVLWLSEPLLFPICTGVSNTQANSYEYNHTIGILYHLDLCNHKYMTLYDRSYAMYAWMSSRP